MSIRPISTASTVFAAFLGGCTLIDQIRFSTAEYVGRGILLECGLSVVQRTANLSAINGWLDRNRHSPRAIALDCDGDGAADF